MDAGFHEATGGAAGRRRRALVSGMALVACVTIAAAAVAWNDLRVRRAAGERYVSALAESHARQLALTLDNLERAFGGVAADIVAIERDAPDAAPKLRLQALAGVQARHGHLVGLRIVRARPRFAAAGGAPGVALGMPRRGSVGWELPLASALPDAPDGGDRWLTGGFDLRALREVLAAHEVGRQGVASVVHASGTLVARSIDGTRHAGVEMSHSALFDAAAASPAGVVESRSPIDGVRRLVGYRRLADYPLVATVGMTPSALYGGWWPFAATLAGGCVLLLLVWLAGLRFLAASERRESTMRRSIASSESAMGHLRERVRDVEAQYQFLYDRHPLPACVFDREDLRILEVNEAAIEQYGYDRDAFLALRADDLLAEGSAEEVRAEISAHPQTHGSRIWTHRRRDGSTFKAMIFASDLVAFRDRPARLVLALDITDRVRAEADLRLLRRAVEAAEEGLFVADAAHRRLVYGNGAFERISGLAILSDGQSGGVDVADVAGGDAAARRTLVDAMARGRDVHVEARVGVDDGAGGVRWRGIRVSPVRDGDGRPSHFVGVVRDITERREAAEALAFRASHDPLTGLANRGRLIEAIDAAIADGDRVVVCDLDLDDFQLVNDSLGHAVGDELLVAIARRMEAQVGSDGLAAHVGGDEFAALLRCQRGEDVPAAVAALAEAVATPVEVRGVALHVTPSVGYSCYPADGDSGTGLLRAASQATAHAKRRGRNLVLAHRPEFDPRAAARLELVLQLREALRAEQFELVFQLQFDDGTQPCGMEALLRWRHPTRGLLGPGEFIAASEQAGLMPALGRWVLGEAARHWCLLDRAGWGHLRVAVNVSAVQFREGLADDVASVVQRYSLPPKVLELELTESVVVDNPDAARAEMLELSRLGAVLAIDDFGTGYSSLSYLKHLPLQRLKLDRSFVRDLGRDPDAEALCGAILGMARSLGLRITAEGVETEAQRSWLRARDCDEFQGYLLARPMPFADVLARLGDGSRPQGAQGRGGGVA